MTPSQAVVGAHTLPSALVNAIESGRWRPPADDLLLVEVFGEQPDGPRFYGFPEMVSQNRLFQQGPPVKPFWTGDEDLGIAPASTVLIGDLGVDMPIALDYRLSKIEPRVLYLASSGWVEVAPNVESLLVALKISR